MIQSNEQLSAANVLAAEKKVITEKEIIHSLKGICEQRSAAIRQYPSSKYYASGMEAVNRIRQTVAEADDCLNPKTAVKLCLRTELDFHYLSPKTTIAIFRDYHTRLEFWMVACRLILQYQKQ